MKMWITGAKGLLGKALAEATKGSSIGSGREVDIGDLDAVRAFAKANLFITHIVNCAAFSLVDLSETNREEAFRTNALGPENLGKVAQEIGAKFIHLSTDYVYPGDITRPLKETDPVGPLNYYGETKLEGEKRVQKIMPTASVLRTSWIFGRGGKNFVGTLLQLLQEKEEVRLSNDQWGRPTYAPDLAAAILQMMNTSGLYQFANAGAATKFTFGCAMRDLAEQMKWPIRAKSLVAVPSTTFPSVCKRPAYSVFDTSKIERILKTPIRTWQEALREFLCITTS